MEVLLELESNGVQKDICMNTSSVENVLNLLDDYQAAAITNVHIAMRNQEKEVLGCHVEICGLTPALLLKTCRFFFVEMAWERLQFLAPRLVSYTEAKEGLKQELLELNHCCQVVFMSEHPSVTMLDEQVDYLQSLEDVIRCGQVSFVEHFTDTNINRERLAVLLVAGMFDFAEHTEDYERLETVVQSVVPEFQLGSADKNELHRGLEQMIGYVNSICD